MFQSQKDVFRLGMLKFNQTRKLKIQPHKHHVRPRVHLYCSYYNIQLCTCCLYQLYYLQICGHFILKNLNIMKLLIETLFILILILIIITINELLININ